MIAVFSRGSVWIVTAALCGLCGCVHQETRLQSDDEKERTKELSVRTVGDVTSVANATPINVSGVGIVVGLEGTGSNPTPDGYRTVLEDYLRKRGVDHLKELLASPDTSLVLVTAMIPPGARKGDPLDIEVTLPPHSKTTSLKGGYLMECVLFNYDTTKHLSPNSKGGNRLVSGHPLAKAWGPLLVGFSGGDDKAKLQVARIWGGGRCDIDRPVFLVLNSDQQRAQLGIRIAERINLTMQGDFGAQVNTLAKPQNNQLVILNVAPQYRLNLPRYLRVVRMIPLQDGPALVTYRKRLTQDLQDPDRTVVSALRLEALGMGSKDVFKSGLDNDHPLVRFCSAESLAYLGDPSCGEVLAQMVEEQPALRAFSLTAMASLDETVCHVRLRELLGASSAETRYGAFRALRELQDEDPGLQGVEINDSFWVHRVAPESSPLVHLSLQRRPEVVVFGNGIKLLPPFSILAGEYTITAAESDTKATLCRMSVHSGVARTQCDLGIEDVLANLGKLGATYPNVVEFLEKAGNAQRLSAPVRVDALPKATTVYELASKDAGKLLSQDPETLHADLGATPTLFEKNEMRRAARRISSDDRSTLTRPKTSGDSKSARSTSIWD